jgi:hypothetical protein
MDTEADLCGSLPEQLCELVGLGNLGCPDT